MNDLDALLERLTTAYGAGYAGDASDVIMSALNEIGLASAHRPDGSVFAVLPGGSAQTILIACHADEIALMVSAIDDQGFISMSEIGGCDQRIYPGQDVVIQGKNRLSGYIALKPPHLMSATERKKVWPVRELFVDTGLPADRVRSKVQIGDTIFFVNRYRRLTADRRSGKSMDNRASIASGILALGDLITCTSRPAVHFVATSQEEYTGLGARIASNRAVYDAAIVIDVTHGEFPDLGEGEFYPLGAGPVILCGGTVPSTMFRRLTETARALDMPYQVEPIPSWTGTDADSIAFNRAGTPTAVLGIPLRYMHTPVEVVSLKDIERTARLTAEYIKRF